MLELMINFDVHIVVLFIQNLNKMPIGMECIWERMSIMTKPGFSTTVLKPGCLI